MTSATRERLERFDATDAWSARACNRCRPGAVRIAADGDTVWVASPRAQSCRINAETGLVTTACRSPRADAAGRGRRWAVGRRPPQETATDLLLRFDRDGGPLTPDQFPHGIAGSRSTTATRGSRTTACRAARLDPRRHVTPTGRGAFATRTLVSAPGGSGRRARRTDSLGRSTRAPARSWTTRSATARRTSHRRRPAVRLRNTDHRSFRLDRSAVKPVGDPSTCRTIPTRSTAGASTVGHRHRRRTRSRGSTSDRPPPRARQAARRASAARFWFCGTSPRAELARTGGQRRLDRVDRDTSSSAISRLDAGAA